MASNYAVFVCGNGCGYVERARMWDSPPIGRDGELRCPDCGGQVWDYLRLDKDEANILVESGEASSMRYRHGV